MGKGPFFCDWYVKSLSHSSWTATILAVMDFSCWVCFKALSDHFRPCQPLHLSKDIKKINLVLEGIWANSEVTTSCSMFVHSESILTCTVFTVEMQTIPVRTNKSGAFAYSSWTVAERSNAQILLSFNYFKIYLYRKKENRRRMHLHLKCNTELSGASRNLH